MSGWSTGLNGWGVGSGSSSGSSGSSSGFQTTPYEIDQNINVPDGHWIILVDPELVGGGSITVQGDGQAVIL